MIKRITILMLLMALFAPWAANAQETVAIGDGTSTSYYTPYNSLFNYSFVEQIYTADEIGMAGTINSIAFYLRDSDASQTNDFVVYMKNVQRSSFSSNTDYETVTSADIVFSGSFTFSAGWSTLTLTTPFAYDGSSNLLIAFDENSSGYSTRYFYYTSTSDNKVLDYYSDSYNPDPYNLGSYSGNKAVRTNRANIQLEITTSALDETCEGFENVTGTAYNTAGSMPSGWYSYTTSTGTNIVAPHVTSGSSYNFYNSGSQSVNLESGSNANSNYAYVVLPLYNNVAELTYYSKRESSSQGTLTLGYVDAQTESGCNSFHELADVTPTTTVTQYTIDFINNYTLPTGKYIAFRWQASGSYYACCLDDVCVTTVSCNAPSHVTISDETTTGATVAWNGYSDSYLITVTQEGFTFDFEDGTSQGWTTLKGSTGTSTHNWMHNSQYSAYDSNGDLIVPVCHNSSSGMMLSESYISAATSGGSGSAVTPDNYLVSPQIQLGGSISFYAASRMSNYPAEKFSVMVSESGNTSVSDFTHTELTVTLSDNNWHLYTVDLSAYSGMGYVAIRHYDCYDQHLLYIDDITIGKTYAATSSPFTINDPEFIKPWVTYNVQVIGICSGVESDPSETVTFTTASDCPVPTDITVTNETAHGATISWNGTSDSYIVMVGESMPISSNSYNFDDSTLDGWTNIDADGDGYVWVLGSACGSIYLEEGASLADNGHNASADFVTSGSFTNVTNTVLTPDNYLVSPQVELGGRISFWVCGQDANYAAEHFGVAVSTTGNTNAADFTTIQQWTLTAKGVGASMNPGTTRSGNRDQGSWYQFTADLSAYSGMGYVAIRHFNISDQFMLDLDDITIESGSVSSWMTYSADASPFILNDTQNIHPETTYVVKVIGVCDGEEGPVSTATSFTTAIACPAPTNVAVSDITGHEATVTWTGSSNSYIVSYRTAEGIIPSFTEGFENGIGDWTLRNCASSTGVSTSSSYIHSGNASFCFVYNTNPPQYLISPMLTSVSQGMKLEFYYKNSSTTWPEIFQVGFSSTDNETSSFTFGTEYTASDAQWHLYSETIPAGTKYICWKLNSNDQMRLCIDDIVVGTMVTAGEWQTITTENEIVTLTSLTSETLYEVVVQGDCGDEGLSSTTDPVSFITDVSCPAPTNLIVSDIDGHGATVSWDKIATQETGDITYNYTWVEHGGTPDWTLHGGMSAFDRWTNEMGPRAFAFGLDPETTYDFYVRRDCGDEGYSAEVVITFTTTVVCPAPTNVTVSDITGHGATVSWTGPSDSYNVMYRTPAYIDGVIEEFGTSIPTGWEMYTGLLSNGTATMASVTYGWSFGTGNGVFDNHARVNIYSNFQRWLVMPEFTVPADIELSFDLALTAYSGSEVPAPATTGTDDKFMVLISTDNMSTWTTLREWNNSGSSYVYNNIANTATGESVSIDLRAYAGRSVRIAFYGESTESNADNNLHIDNVVAGRPVAAGEWQTITVEDTTALITGLTAETLYEVVVISDCGDEGMSSESEPVTFTTDVTCPAPTDLIATDVTSNSAVLNWTSDAESYNVSYYKSYFFDSFESEEDFYNQWTVYHEGDPDAWVWAIENPTDNSSDLSAHSGDLAVVAYGMDSVQADNWLVSPPIELPSQATLKFWVMRSTYDDYQDEYEVRLSTTGNAIEDFDDIVLKPLTVANSEWTEEVIDLSAYDGQTCYIAIRHYHYNGFFLMVDDFGIYGWSEPIATTDNSLLIEDLLPETEYLWQVQANCGDEDGMSQWSSIGTFTTLKACPVPFDLTATEITANGATIAWTGYNDSYNIWVGQLETVTINYDFEDNSISADFTNDATYPWTVVANNHSGSYCAKSGNALIGANSTTSAMQLEVELVSDGILSFSGKVSSESGWDKAYFSIDGTVQSNLSAISGAGDWIDYEYPLTAGTHTLRWYYTKDTSNDVNDDCFYVDDISIESDVVSSEMTYTATESPFLLNDATNIHPETIYLVKVKGICDDEETEYSESITFTTLDESTKIFVIEGDWSDGSNWIPAGVPTIEENVILRAEATVFDVAEANIITIENDVTLTIEDGGQLKTNADVEATMKRFIIGYGTDYVETNYGYYLMALPTAAPISATDAGLITEESDYDLYSWDRTATDEEWQNNHDGIDLQNGVGYLYSNRDDMEMSFTATLRNSSEPVVVTPSYDEVEHGGWNLYGNPFPCEAYITTDAEGMTFYRLVDNELVPVEGAIAPLEAFFVKATAAGQTFTISREAPDESK